MGEIPTKGKLMKAKLAIAGILLCLGSGTSYAQHARDLTSEGQATIKGLRRVQRRLRMLPSVIDCIV
jgi:hypothetical protein